MPLAAPVATGDQRACSRCHSRVIDPPIALKVSLVKNDRQPGGRTISEYSQLRNDYASIFGGDSRRRGASNARRDRINRGSLWTLGRRPPSTSPKRSTDIGR